MATVLLSKKGAMDFAKTLQSFNEDDKQALRYWIEFVKDNGILMAQENSDFRDHALIGKWNGYRAASFGYSARVIYRILDSKIEIVEIERITISHDYQR